MRKRNLITDPGVEVEVEAKVDLGRLQGLGLQTRARHSGVDIRTALPAIDQDIGGEVEVGLTIVINRLIDIVFPHLDRHTIQTRIQ